MPYIEKRPQHPNWDQLQNPPGPDPSPTLSTWANGRFLAISQLADMKLPSGGIGPTWTISISRQGSRRPRDREVRRILREFSMWPTEEDNHEPGIARKFFMSVDPAERTDCECKANEEQVVEPDGYTWSRPIV